MIEDTTSSEAEIEAFLAESSDIDESPAPEPAEELAPSTDGDPGEELVEAAVANVGDPVPEPEAPAPEPISDYNTIVRTLEDGTQVVDLHRIPENVKLAYGDDPEKDLYTRSEADWRRSTYDRLSNEARELQQKLGGEAFIEDGRSKVQLYDELQNQLRNNADDFITKVAAEVTDPVMTAWNIIAKHSGREIAQQLLPAFQALHQEGWYDQTQGQKEQLTRQQQALQQERAQIQMDQARREARAHVEQELAGHALDDSTWQQVERQFIARQRAHQADPEIYPAPTFAAVWAELSAQQTKRPGPMAPPTAVTPPPIEVPRRNAPGQAPGSRELSAGDEIELWLAEG